MHNHADVVRALIDCPNVDVAARLPRTEQDALHIACQRGHVDCVKVLLSDRRTCVNSRAKDHSTPLISACVHNQLNCVRVLLSCGAVDVNATTTRRNTALTLTCEQGYAQVLSLLLACSRTRVQHRDRDLSTALHIAAKEGHSECVVMLLNDSRTDVNARNESYRTPLMEACRHDNSDCVRALLSCDIVDVNAVGTRFESALHIACQRGHADIVKMLVLCGRVNVCSLNKDFHTALHDAVNGNHTECVRILMQCERIDANVANTLMHTPLVMACKKDYLDIVDILVSSAAVDVNTMANGMAPLHHAYDVGSISIAMRLHACDRVRPDLVSHCGETALHFACDSGNVKCVRFLLKNMREDMNTPNDIGDTPLHYALSTSGSATRLYHTLTTCGQPDVTRADSKGEYPLHMAAEVNNSKWLRWILRHPDADVNALDAKGRHVCEILMPRWDALRSRINARGSREALCMCTRLNLNTICQDGQTALGLMLSCPEPVPELSAMIDRCDVKTLVAARSESDDMFHPALMDAIMSGIRWGEGCSDDRGFGRGDVVRALVLISIRGCGRAAIRLNIETGVSRL